MKRTNFILLLIFPAFALLSFNCFIENTRPCIKGEGAVVTENREINGSSRIILESSAQLNITKGKDYSCSINGQKNILDNLIFKREGDKLTITEKECVTGNTDLTINLTLPSLTLVDLGGAGNIQVTGAFNVSSFEAFIGGSGNIHIKDSIVAGTLHTKISGSGDISLRGSFKKAETEISGSGNIRLAGNCNNNEIDISGSGKVHAYDLRTVSTNIQNSGSGNSEVNASQTLNIDISGSGNVCYKGNSAVTKSISGSGSVCKK